MMLMSNRIYANATMHVLCQQQTKSHAAEQIHVTNLYVTSDHILVGNKNPLLLCQIFHTMGAILALGSIDYVPCMNFHLEHTSGQ